MTKKTLLAICILGTVALNGAGCSSSSSGTAEPAAENATTTETVTTEATEATTEAAESAAPLAFGETGTIGEWNVTVTGSETAKRVDEDIMYFEASEDKTS